MNSLKKHFSRRLRSRRALLERLAITPTGPVEVGALVRVTTRFRRHATGIGWKMEIDLPAGMVFKVHTIDFQKGTLCFRSQVVSTGQPIVDMWVPIEYVELHST